MICKLTSPKLFGLHNFHLENICCKYKDLPFAPGKLAGEGCISRPPGQDSINSSISAVSISETLYRVQEMKAMCGSW